MSKFLGASVGASFGVSMMLLAACATGGAGLGRDAKPSRARRFEVTSIEDRDPGFPIARDPKLPSADRLTGRIWASSRGSLRWTFTSAWPRWPRPGRLGRSRLDARRL